MLKQLVLGLIRFYRRGISSLTPPSCRFTPTCSAYAAEAVERYGVGRGGWLFLRRFVRCGPFGGGGYDPVPAEPEGKRRESGLRLDGGGARPRGPSDASMRRG